MCASCLLRELIPFMPLLRGPTCLAGSLPQGEEWKNTKLNSYMKPFQHKFLAGLHKASLKELTDQTKIAAPGLDW